MSSNLPLVRQSHRALLWLGGALIGDKYTFAANSFKMEGGAYKRRGRNIE